MVEDVPIYKVGLRLLNKKTANINTTKSFEP